MYLDLFEAIEQEGITEDELEEHSFGYDDKTGQYDGEDARKIIALAAREGVRVSWDAALAEVRMYDKKQRYDLVRRYAAYVRGFLDVITEYGKRPRK